MGGSTQKKDCILETRNRQVRTFALVFTDNENFILAYLCAKLVSDAGCQVMVYMSLNSAGSEITLQAGSLLAPSL